MPYTLSDADIKSLLALCEKLHAEGKAQKSKKVMEFLRSQMKIKKAKAELEKLRKERDEAKEAERALKLREVRGKTDKRKIANFLLTLAKARREKKKADARRKLEEKVAEAKARAKEAEVKAKEAPSAPASAGAGGGGAKLTPEEPGKEAKPGAKIKYTYGGVQFLKEPQYLEKVLDVLSGDYKKGEKVDPKFQMRKRPEWTTQKTATGGKYYKIELKWDDIVANASHPAYTTDVEAKKARYFASIKPKTTEMVVHEIKTTKDGKEVLRGKWSYDPEGNFTFVAGAPYYADTYPVYRGNKIQYSYPRWERNLETYIKSLKDSIAEDRAEARGEFDD